MNSTPHSPVLDDLRPRLRRMFAGYTLTCLLALAAFLLLHRSTGITGEMLAWIGLFGGSTALYIWALFRALHTPLTRLEDTLLDSQTRSTREQDYAEQIVTKQAEIDALQSQINPHFLYNTLDSIRGKALSEGVPEIADMTAALSAFFRYSVSKKSNLVTLDDELRNIDHYFAIQRYRFDNRFTLNKVLEEGDGLLECALPKLTIQPVVENAIYHGLEMRIGGGTITIRVTATERRLIIHVVDDGVGMDTATLDALNQRLDSGQSAESVQASPRSSGIALTNVNQRIKLLCGEQYGITVYSTLDLGTDVEIVLPRIPYDKTAHS
jgi:two-component system sensor histidine kinase YesM